MARSHTASSSPPPSTTGDGRGSRSDDELPSFQRRATPRQVIDRVRNMMVCTSVLSLQYQQLLLGLLRAQQQQPATPADPAVPAVPINNPPMTQVQRLLTRFWVWAPSHIALAAPSTGGRRYARNVSVVEEIGRRLHRRDSTSGSFGRNVDAGNGVYATPPIVVPPPRATPVVIAPTIDVRHCDPQPPRPNSPPPPDSRPLTSASGSRGVGLFRFGLYRPLVPRPNQASSSNNPPPPPRAHPIQQGATGNTKTYECDNCHRVFQNRYRFSTHFHEHYKNEDPKTRATRKASKADERGKKRSREGDRELCLAHSAQGLTVVPTQMERESSLLIRYEKKNKPGLGESSGSGGQNQVENENQIGSGSVKAEPVV